MREELLKEIFQYIRDNYKGTYQIFDNRNVVGDTLFKVQTWDNVTLEYCPSYDYFEIFGLNDEEFAFIRKQLNEVAEQ